MKNLFRGKNNNESQSELMKFPYDTFWEGFRLHLSDNKSELKVYDNDYDIFTDSNGIERSYLGFHFGHFTYFKAPVWMCAVAVPDKNFIYTEFCFKNKDNKVKSLLEKLESDKLSIEDYMSCEVDWDMIRKNKFRIGIVNQNVNLKDESYHLDIYEWLHFNLERLEKTVMWKISSYYIDILPSLSLGQIKL